MNGRKERSETIRQVIAPPLSLAGRSAKQIDEAAIALAVRHNIEIEAPTRAGVIAQLVAILEEEGFFVGKAQRWEKTSIFRARLQLTHEAFHRILASPHHPPVEVERKSGTGKIIAVSSNPIFEDYARTHRGKSPKAAREKKPRKSRALPADQLKRNRKGEGRRKK